MIKTLIARFKQGYRTQPFPPEKDLLSERYMGLPRVSPDATEEDYQRCKAVCPTGAIGFSDNRLTFDLGKCIFCGECQKACLNNSIVFGRDFRMAARRRQDLVLSSITAQDADNISRKIKNIFGKSLKLRQVSAGGCNACEADINVLGTLSFDLGRFGIQFVASPRHADGIVVTGAVTDNMKLALEKTYRAIPSPKLVIAVGACAISGGPYIDHEETNNGVDSVIPVDMYIPGCPPHPLSILDGLLKIKA